jgi:ssDNA-binding Zn-finger/Zn-ribbon topoisomerase 1
MLVIELCCRACEYIFKMYAYSNAKEKEIACPKCRVEGVCSKIKSSEANFTDTEYISITKMSEKLKIKRNSLLNSFSDNGWLIKEKKTLRLTPLGEKIGGIYNVDQNGGYYITWNRNLINNIELADISSKQDLENKLQTKNSNVETLSERNVKLHESNKHLPFTAIKRSMEESKINLNESHEVICQNTEVAHCKDSKVHISDLDSLTNKFKYVLLNEISEVTILKSIDEIESAIKLLNINQISNEYQILMHLPEIKGAIFDFTDTCEEIHYATNLEDYHSIYERLNKFLNIFENCAMVQRIEKEIREISDKLPKIVKNENDILRAKLNKKINVLESNSPLCKNGHEMVIREDGKGGFFWGCSLFPECFSRRWLNKEQIKFLNIYSSDKEDNDLISQYKIRNTNAIVSDLSGVPSEKFLNLHLDNEVNDLSFQDAPKKNKAIFSDLPREKALKNGIKVLSDVELLALILRTGTTEENVIELSDRILKSYTLRDLSGFTIEDFMEINGIGVAKASELSAIFEIYNRLSNNNTQFKSQPNKT